MVHGWFHCTIGCLLSCHLLKLSGVLLFEIRRYMEKANKIAIGMVKYAMKVDGYPIWMAYAIFMLNAIINE